MIFGHEIQYCDIFLKRRECWYLHNDIYINNYDFRNQGYEGTFQIKDCDDPIYFTTGILIYLGQPFLLLHIA